MDAMAVEAEWEQEVGSACSVVRQLLKMLFFRN